MIKTIIVITFVTLMTYVLSTQAVFAEIIIDCDKIRNNETLCMACNIYYEARSESILGQSLVGLVVLSRVSSPKYPDNICKVIWQPYQFSWTKDGISDKVLNSEAWLQAIQISKRLQGINNPYISNILWYHNEDMVPWWAATKSRVATVGRHIFYTE